MRAANTGREGPVWLSLTGWHGGHVNAVHRQECLCYSNVLTNCDYTGKPVATTRTSPRKRSNRKQLEKPWAARKLSGLTVLQVPAFTKIPWLIHGFSTRPGGVSDAGGEKVLNLGAVEWDTRENVEENKHRFQAAVGAADHTLISLHQIHSDVVRSFDSVRAKQWKGDASVTKHPGLLLGVRTADCAP